MPKYQDDIIEHLKDRVDRFNVSIKISPVKWAYTKPRGQALLQIKLAQIGVHRIMDGVCNCGLLVERSIKHGHRDHKTKHRVREVDLVIHLGEE